MSLVDKPTEPDPASRQAGSLLSADGQENKTPAVSMTSQAYERLRTDIMSGVLKPGEKLKVEALRKRYEVGSSPIREALSALSAEYLVERIDQRGFRVALVSLEAFNELLKTRCWLEERALRESIAHGGSDWEEKIVLAMFHLSKASRVAVHDHAASNGGWEELHKRFHMALISGCGSAILVNYCDQLYDQNVLYRHAASLEASSKRDVSEEHSAIVEAALARDADLAVERLITHYQHTGELLKKRMNSAV